VSVEGGGACAVGVCVSGGTDSPILPELARLFSLFSKENHSGHASLGHAVGNEKHNSNICPNRLL